MIIEENLAYLKNNLNFNFNGLQVGRLVSGNIFTAVQLSDGSCGMAKSENAGCYKSNTFRKRYTGKFSPGYISGSNVLELLESDVDYPNFHVIKLAVINAIASEIILKGNYSKVSGKDAIDFVDLNKGNNIVLVGAFQSYIKKIAESGCSLKIVELEESAIDSEYRDFYVNVGHSAEALASATTVIVTGAVLANNTFDKIMVNIPSSAQLLLVGPSGGVLPEIMFRRNVNIIGTICITDPEKMFKVVAEGGSTYHLFAQGCASKICIING